MQNTPLAWDTLSTPIHVLVVEDSQYLSDAFRIMLERSGFRVSVAGNIAGALALEEQVDVLLLDLSLPDGDGISLLARLHASGRAPRGSVALTGHDDPITRQRCLSAGCAQVLVKPVAVAELIATVRTVGSGESLS
jgi:DNA-binding response OmpR family regulator